jgi:hypothetical protein
LQLAAHRPVPPTGNIGDHGEGRAKQMRG